MSAPPCVRLLNGSAMQLPARISLPPKKRWPQRFRLSTKLRPKVSSTRQPLQEACRASPNWSTPSPEPVTTTSHEKGPSRPFSVSHPTYRKQQQLQQGRRLTAALHPQI